MFAVGTERQGNDIQRLVRRQRSVKMGKQRPAARLLPAKAHAEPAGLGRDKHEPGLPGAMPPGASLYSLMRWG